MSWTGGYVSEVDYTHGYYRELAPLHSRLALAHKSVAAAPLDRPRYLELGFGQGVSFAIHAAANPGEYWGTDFNPAQAAEAAELVVASGSGAHVHDQSFQEVAGRDDLPLMDMIVLHGIWSWISEENRRCIVDIVSRRLKVGGVLYLSYNVTPGWAPSMPLRHLMALYAERSASSAEGMLAAVSGAVDFVQKVADGGARYFQKNPAVLERFNKLKSQSPKYLAHEYFTQDWHPMPFSQAVSELDPAKVTFACSANVLDHLDGIHLSADAQTLLGGIADPVFRESVRDFFVNTQFRRDLFVRGPRKLAAPAQQAELRKLRFVLGRRADSVELSVKGVLGGAKLHESVYRPLLEALEADGMRPKSLGEVESAVAKHDIPLVQLAQAAVVLVGKGDAFVAHEQDVAEAVRPRTTALNRHLLERARVNGDIQFLASPVAGSGVFVTRIEQLFLLARGEGESDPNGWARAAWRELSAQGHRIMKDGKRLDSAEENLSELMRQASEWKQERLPWLVTLGVAE